MVNIKHWVTAWTWWHYGQVSSCWGYVIWTNEIPTGEHS